jgi:hypothetical protein
VHAVALPTANSPVEQATTLAVVVLLHSLPGGHAVQTADPRREYVPELHAMVMAEVV